MKKLILACALLAGCSDVFTTTTASTDAPTTVEVTPVVNPTASIVNQVEIGNICADVSRSAGTTAAQAGIADLRAQAAFTEAELGYIANRQVANGMSEKAAICALGGNSIPVTEVKTLTSPGHVVKTFTFGDAGGTVLVTDNGVVTSLRQ